MNREFHIVASNDEESFTTQGIGAPVEFLSLFEAARYARSAAGCENGMMVINDERGRVLSRIPFNVTG